MEIEKGQFKVSPFADDMRIHKQPPQVYQRTPTADEQLQQN